jgi:hypothetical protein
MYKIGIAGHPASQSGARAFRYRTGSGIGISVHSGTVLTGCRTVRHRHFLSGFSPVPLVTDYSGIAQF